MPELSEMTAAGAKTGLGTMFAGPDEAVKVIQANYPGTKVDRDEKGNYLTNEYKQRHINDRNRNVVRRHRRLGLLSLVYTSLCGNR